MLLMARNFKVLLTKMVIIFSILFLRLLPYLKTFRGGQDLRVTPTSSALYDSSAYEVLERMFSFKSIE